MKKHFTTALAMAAAITANAQVVLEYNGEAVTLAKGEKVDTVNWLANTWADEGGTLKTGVADADASNGLAVEIVNPNTCNDWERCLKFDGLQIKPGTIYRVRLTAKAPFDAPVQICMLRGDENCDMPWVAVDENGSKGEFRYNVSGFDEFNYSTKTAMFYYTSDALQQQFYSDYNKSQAMPDNQFLRLTFKGEGTYMMDGVLVEEAPIAGIFFNDQAVIKVDFGFSTNAAALAKAAGGTVALDASMFTVTVNGEAVVPDCVELKDDGGMYIFLNDEEVTLDEESKVVVSFKNTGCGVTYSGVLTPGNGKDVVSFEAEVGQYDENVDAISSAYEPATLVSVTPADGSFELDGSLNEFTFTYNKKVFVCGDNAPTAVLDGDAANFKPEELDAVTQDDELGTTVIFRRKPGGGNLNNGSYTITVTGVTNSKYVSDENAVDRIDFEVGKVQVAETVYTDVEKIGVIGENGNHSENWTSYFNGEEVVPTGSGIRTFTFPDAGQFTTGFYLSQREAENGAELSYGEKPDYPFTLPAGNVQIAILVSAWQNNTGNFGYVLTDASGNEVAVGSGSAEVHQADTGTPVTDYSRVYITIPDCAAGNYVLKLSTNNGGFGNAIIVWGLDVKTYTQSAGVSANNEVIINEDFSAVGDGKAPEEGMGWTIYDNGNPGTKGETQSGRNRIMATKSCSNMSIGFYNRCFGDPAAYNMTYGEVEQGEPAFEMDAVKYSFSWLACNWKGDENTYYFQILDEDGVVVYERQDVVHANVNGGGQTAEAEKISFNYTPKEPGRYILNWYMTGESIVGKIKVEKMGSLAAYYRNLLNEAVAAAKVVREEVSDDMFAGSTRDALDAAIAAASNPDYHTGAEYTAAIDELNGYVKAMTVRREAMAEYSSVLSNCAGMLEELADTKYAALDAYIELQALYNQYSEVSPSALEDDVLLPVQQQLTLAYNYVINMKNSVVGLYTKQIDQLLTAISLYDYEGAYTESDVVIAAGNALTDDQTLAANLQKMLTAAIYERCAEGDDLFETYDEEIDEHYPESIDLSGYIQNADVYCTVPKNEKENIPADKAMSVFPGWTVEGTVCVAWSWDSWNVSETLPAENGRFATPWGGSFTVSQQVNNLPVGIYSYSVDTGDGSHMSEYDAESNTFGDGYENQSTIFYTVGSETTYVPFNLANSNPWRGMATCTATDIELPAGEYSLASMTIGAAPKTDGEFANIDNFRLYMSGKLAGFDYKAAAAALKQEIQDAIESIKEDERNDAPVSTVYYNAAGVRATAPKGIAIKVERWADGYMRVTKTVKK